MADNATGAPPAVDAGAAPAAPAVPAADPSAGFKTHEELLAAIRELSPEEARELNAEYARTYHAPPPAPLHPSTPAEASARLAQLRTQDEWCRKLNSGDIRTAEEFHRLSELAAQAGPFDPVTDIGDWSSGPGMGDQLSRRNMLSAADDLRAKGINEEAIHHFLNGGKFTRETVADAQFWLGRMERDPSLLRSDLPPDREYQMLAQRMIIAAGTG
jgi:hypothetical protein